MRKTLFLLFVLGLTGSLWAADPIIGTWKLNVEKSNDSEGMRNKELTEIYKELDSDLIELTRTGIRMDGSSVFEKYIFPRQGGEAKIISKSMNKAIPGAKYVGLFVAVGEWYTAFLRDGTQIMLIHKLISEDRKTMQQTFRRMDEGRYSESTMFFDRQ